MTHPLRNVALALAFWIPACSADEGPVDPAPVDAGEGDSHAHDGSPEGEGSSRADAGDAGTGEESVDGGVDAPAGHG